MPYELLRKNFRSAHWTFEKDSTTVKGLLKDAATGSLNGKNSPEDVLKSLDTMLAKMRGLKQKLGGYADEEARLYKQINARFAHLQEISDMHTIEDVKYEAWSQQRLDRLLVDYLLRHGYCASATALADERQIGDLVDIETFVAMNKIRKSLKEGSVTEALAWCNDNKKELRKMDVRITPPSASVPAIFHLPKEMCLTMLFSPVSSSCFASSSTLSWCEPSRCPSSSRPSRTQRSI